MTRLEIGVGDHPNLFGDDVLYLDLRDCGIRPLVMCDVFGPLPLPPDYFFYIASHHVLEHCSWKHTDGVLKEWVRVLAPGGTIHAELPDLRWQALRVLWDPLDRDAVNKIFGDQDFPNDTNVHRTGFTAASLALALQQAGLTEIRVSEVGGCLVADARKE